MDNGRYLTKLRQVLLSARHLNRFAYCFQHGIFRFANGGCYKNKMPNPECLFKNARKRGRNILRWKEKGD